MERKRVLLIVDPQNDFIDGTLPVPGAAGAMDRLARWISDNPTRYNAVLVTMDQHPNNHCSFVQNGGQWPRHCVKYSVGAALYPAVETALGRASEYGVPITYIEKATDIDRDAYSAFEREIPSLLTEAEHIYLAGLAGDYCVAATERDLLRSIPPERIERLEECIAYITAPN